MITYNLFFNYNTDNLYCANLFSSILYCIIIICSFQYLGNHHFCNRLKQNRFSKNQTVLEGIPSFSVESIVLIHEISNSKWYSKKRYTSKVLNSYIFLPIYHFQTIFSLFCILSTWNQRILQWNHDNHKSLLMWNYREKYK